MHKNEAGRFGFVGCGAALPQYQVVAEVKLEGPVVDGALLRKIVGPEREITYWGSSVRGKEHIQNRSNWLHDNQ